MAKDYFLEIFGFHSQFLLCKHQPLRQGEPFLFLTGMQSYLTALIIALNAVASILAAAEKLN